MQAHDTGVFDDSNFAPSLASAENSILRAMFLIVSACCPYWQKSTSEGYGALGQETRRAAIGQDNHIR